MGIWLPQYDNCEANNILVHSIHEYKALLKFLFQNLASEMLDLEQVGGESYVDLVRDLLEMKIVVGRHCILQFKKVKVK